VDIKELEKKFAESTRHEKLAVEAIAKTLSDPSVQTVLEQHRKMATEAVRSLICGPVVGDLQTTMEAAIREAREQMLLYNKTALSDINTQMRSLVGGLNLDTISGLKSGFSYQASEFCKLNERLLASIKPPEINLPTVRHRHWEYEWRHESVMPFVPENRESLGAQFWRRLGEHLESAEKEAMASGGQRVVRSKCPGGDEIRVSQISLEDEHFVRIEGVDQFNQLREFTSHHSAIGITIEVVPAEGLEQNGIDEEVVN